MNYVYMFDIFIIFIEALYFYIPINKIKQNKNNKEKIILYLNLIFSDIVSFITFKNSIFRYVMYFMGIYFSTFAFNKDTGNKNKLLDFFIAPILFFIKAIIEYIIYLCIFKFVNYTVFVLILELLCILFAICFKNKIFNIYIKFKNRWNDDKEFYSRYLILLIFNVFVIFLIYNLIKIKEVL